MTIITRFLLIGALIVLLTSCTDGAKFVRPNLSEAKELRVKSTTLLPAELAEISGMALLDSLLLVINDSGNSSSIYKVSAQNGSIISTHLAVSLFNRDWEEISYSDSTVYVGDFGNNSGSRQDLVIHKFSIEELMVDTIRHSGKIEFKYKYQDNFAPRYLMHQWDCEAMVVNDDVLSIFSKNWKTQVVYQYNIPRDGSSEVVEPVDSLNLGILVTGAALDKAKKRLAFCGYFANEMYLALLTDFTNNSFLDGSYMLYRIPELAGRQVESVIFYKGGVLLGSEATLFQQALYFIEIP